MEVEKQILRNLIEKPNIITEQSITSDFFIDERLKKIFVKIRGLFVKDLPITYDTLAHKLGKQNISVLDEIYSTAPLDNTEVLIYERREESARANIDEYANKLRLNIMEGSDLFKSISEFQQNIARVCKDFGYKTNARNLYSLYEEWLSGEGKKTIDVGWGNWNQYQTSVGDYCIIAARPGQGKTTLAINLAKNMAEKGYNILFFSLEMFAEDIMARLISCATGVSYNAVKIKKVTEYEKRKIESYAKKFQRYNLTIYDDLVYIEDIISECRRKNLEKKIDVVFIDYVGLIQSKKPYDSENIRIADISRSLNALKKETKTTIFILSQLNRRVEERDDKTPKLSDLRDSGALEQDAEQIIFPFRPAYYDKSANPLSMTIFFSKNRNGMIGQIEMKSEMSIMTIDEIKEPRIFDLINNEEDEEI